MKKISATLGFIFTPDYQQVLLIRKRHPDWQAGKINGLGGKSEAGETTTECISREVQEEAAIHIPDNEWKQVTTLLWAEWKVDVFVAVYDGAVRDAQTLTDEEVEWFKVAELPKNMMSNLSWLIPLSIDILTNSQPPKVSVEY